MKKRKDEELEFMSLLLQTIDQAVIATDLEGKVSYWNRAAEKMYGWSFQEAIGKNIVQLTPSNQSREQAVEIMEFLSKGYSWSGEFLVQRKNGSEFPAYVTNSPILDRDNNLIGVIGTSQDISEKKKLQGLLDKTSSLASIGNFEVDCKTGKIYLSSKAIEIFGVMEGLVLTIDIALRIFTEQDQNKIFKAYTEALEDKREFNIDVQIETERGEVKWVRIIGEPQLINNSISKVQGSVQDIDKLKKTELQKKKISEEREKILESISDCFFALNKDFKVTYWNSEAERVLQLSRDRIIGKRLQEAFDLKNTSFEYHYKKAILDQRTQHFQEFFPGTRSWYDVSAYPSPEGLSIFFRDITDQKESNLKLERLNKELEEFTDELIAANKGLEQFSYIVSHNLRAPVANIKGLSDLLKESSFDKNMKRKIFDNLVANVHRLDEVLRHLNDILKVKNKLEDKKELVNFQELVSSIQQSLGDLIEEKNVVIQTNFEAREEMYTVPGYLYSIFYNLILNSIKYGKTEVDPVINISSRVKNEKVSLEFQDNGIGIDLERYKDQIFGLYKRFHHHVEGKGLGLLMVKTQVETLGGKISVFSTPNVGTIFTVEFGLKNKTKNQVKNAVSFS